MKIISDSVLSKSSLSGEEQFEIILEVYEQWFAEFLQTSIFKNISEKYKDYSEFIIFNFAEYMFRYFEEEPCEWSLESMENCVFNIFPRKVSASNELFLGVPVVLHAFFTFLSESKSFQNCKILANSVLGLHQDKMRNVNDKSKWGIAKSFVMGAYESNIDDEDDEEDDEDDEDDEELSLYMDELNMNTSHFHSNEKMKEKKIKKRKAQKEARKKNRKKK